MLRPSVQCLHYMTSPHWSHVMICAVLTVPDEPTLIPCYDLLCSAYSTWRVATDPMLWFTVQCLQYMTSQHWSHVMTQCAVLTVYDEPPLTPRYDPVCSAYSTWGATTDSMLWSTVQCLQYMTSRHWSHAMTQCVVLTVRHEPPLTPRYDPVCSAYSTSRATTDPMLWPSVQCLQYITSHHWSHVMTQCAVLTVHHEQPLIPCYDPVCSAYSTSRATTDPTLRSSVQCLHYMTSQHF